MYWERMLLLTLCVCVAYVLSEVKLCPVSTMPTFTSEHDHLYPIEIYFPSRMSDTVPVPFEMCKVMGKDQNKNFSCPLHSLGCPIIEDNVQSGLSKSFNWTKSTSLCTMKTVLDDPTASVNVFVFGGSVTAGVDTGFCCSLRACNKGETPRCAWPHHFHHWLQSLSKGKVNTYNFGRPGTSSDQSGERLQEYLDSVGVKRFNKQDIILVDHSFNDFAMSSWPAKSKVERGLEKLIRRILTLTVGELPTIILMEMDTRADHRTFYPGIYKNLAEHYGLRIYSYVEAMRTNHSEHHQKAYHHHLTHKHRSDDHPPWHTHLIYADFVSSLLLHEMNECDTTYKRDGATPFTLPVALNVINDSAHCNPAYSPFLRLSYDDILAGTVIGDYSIPINRTWQVRPDRKGRGGIIAELNATDKFEEVQNAPLWMTLNFTVNELDQLMKEGANLVMQLNYMSSYSNSGQARLNVCGNDAFGGAVDALWNDWKTYHYTTPAIYTWDIVECKQSGDEKIKLGLKHWLEDASNSVDMKSYIERVPRTKQLFKIISVMVCRYN